MRFNQEKLQRKITELNQGGGIWIVLDDTHALTKVDVSDETNPTFYPGSGVPIKVFMNTTSGEMRIFPAFIFKED